MEARMWDALVGSMRSAYTASLAEGVVPRPVIMPLVRGELVGLIWARPLYVGEDALKGIAELSNIASAAGADEAVLAWETHDVATACQLPVVGPAPCLNLVHATMRRACPSSVPLQRAADQPESGGPVFGRAAVGTGTGTSNRR
ncbi:hypothetical protein ACTWP5_24990 [Streptomyces sp. 4N509B]|uniref:hypothetical protein n=1 Tax=Streptomyces sp. 4N509B TaxID=3457413 RepID=UPI003FD070D3